MKATRTLTDEALQWMLDELKKKGEVGIELEHILITKAGFKYREPNNDEN
jgi:hypothetical protein